jgi:hypothetical protein
MKSATVLAFVAVNGLSALGWAQALPGDSGLRPAVALPRLERAEGELERASARLSSIADRGGIALPVDPCRAGLPVDPCRVVRLLGGIDGQGEGVLALVDAADHGGDQRALFRRLDRSATTFAWATTRLEGLVADWREVPPGPCAPAANEGLEVLARSAEVAAARASTIDTCTEPASVNRRLDHAGAALGLAELRLTELAEQESSEPPPDPDINPPDPDREAKLAAIVSRAEALAALARSLQRAGISGSR